MSSKFLSALMSVCLILQAGVMPVWAQESKASNVSLSDIELLLSKQREELNRNIYLYAATGAAGTVLIGGGIYAYYTHKKINFLSRRNQVLSQKIYKLENMVKQNVSAIMKDNAVMNKKIANSAKLVRQNAGQVDEVVKYLQEVNGALDSHAKAINTLAEGFSAEAAEGAARRPIGFNAVRQAASEEVAENMVKRGESLAKLAKRSLPAIIIGGLITTAFVLSYNNTPEIAVSSKRIAFERELNSAYNNDNGLFILTVLGLAGEDLTLTSAILHENIGTGRDYYNLFVKQQAEAESNAVEYEKANLANAERNMIEEIRPDKTELEAAPAAMQIWLKGFRSYLNNFEL